MSEWRHADETLVPEMQVTVVGHQGHTRRLLPAVTVCSHCICTTPTPDPASPCGHIYPEDGATCGVAYPFSIHPGPSQGPIGLWMHYYSPTRCTCGHPIERA